MTPALPPEILIGNAFANAQQCAEAGHSCWTSLHDLPPALVARVSDPQELYRAQGQPGEWYLVGQMRYDATPDHRAVLTMFSLALVGDEFEHLPTQEEHSAKLSEASPGGAS